MGREGPSFHLLQAAGGGAKGSPRPAGGQRAACQWAVPRERSSPHPPTLPCARRRLEGLAMSRPLLAHAHIHRHVYTRRFSWQRSSGPALALAPPGQGHCPSVVSSPFFPRASPPGRRRRGLDETALPSKTVPRPAGGRPAARPLQVLMARGLSGMPAQLLG